MSLTLLDCAEPLWSSSPVAWLRATQESFDLVSAPAVADNASSWTCKVMSQQGSVWGRRFGACLPTIPVWSVFQAVTFPSRGHSSRVLTRGSHQQRAAKRETLWQEEGLEQIDLWPLKCHFIASWQKESEPSHTHTHTRKHALHRLHIPNHTDTHTFSAHIRHIRPYSTLWYWAVLGSVYQRVSNLCWHKPSIWGYQQTQTLVQSGKGISAPVQRTHRCRQFQRQRD